MADIKAGRSYKHINMVNVHIYVVEMLDTEMEIMWVNNQKVQLFDDRVPIPSNPQEWYEVK